MVTHTKSLGMPMQLRTVSQNYSAGTVYSPTVIQEAPQEYDLFQQYFGNHATFVTLLDGSLEHYWHF